MLSQTNNLNKPQATKIGWFTKLKCLFHKKIVISIVYDFNTKELKLTVRPKKTNIDIILGMLHIVTNWVFADKIKDLDIKIIEQPKKRDYVV